DLHGIARRFFSPAEYLELASLPAGERLKCFFDCWTRKESFIKAVGDGLSYPLDRFRVTLRPGDPARLVSVDGQDASALPWSLHDVAPSEDYAAALTVASPNCQVYIRRFESAQECAAARGNKCRATVLFEQIVLLGKKNEAVSCVTESR